MSDIKRIEERHQQNLYDDGTRLCPGCEKFPLNEPCDVVKLARALDAFVHPPLDTDWQKVMDDGERTLREVAGEGKP